MTPTQREALTKAEATFRRYGDLHAAKPDPVKAAANYEMADRMATALAEVVEPVAIRGNFDGYGYDYVDNGHGSNWLDRHPDWERLYTAPQPTPVPEPVLFDDHEAMRIFLDAKAGSEKPVGTLRGLRAVVAWWESIPTRSLASLRKPAPAERTVQEPAAKAVLKTLEWCEVRHEYRESEYFCPVCDRDKRQGHEAGCALALALAELVQEPSQRQLDTAMRQWESWKTYALELQGKLVKYEGGSPMILNEAAQPRKSALTADQIEQHIGYRLPPSSMRLLLELIGGHSA